MFTITLQIFTRGLSQLIDVDQLHVFLGGKWYIFGGINTDVGHEILQDVTILEPELKKKEGI